MNNTFDQLIKALEAITLLEPTTKKEYESLERECWKLSECIRTNHFGNNCPSEIWHYLADADIRYKDADYAKLTTAKFLTALHAWSEHEKSIQSDPIVKPSNNNKSIVKVYNPFHSLFSTILGAVFGGAVFFILSMGLGVVTGVLGICAKATIWWIIFFLLCFVFGLFSTAYYSGRWTYRRYRKACNM